MRTILIIEDDAEVSSRLKTVLSGKGYHVVHAENGREGLRLLRQAPPSVILLDMRMPIMDGTQFLVARKQEPDWMDIPVVVLSGDQGIDLPSLFEACVFIPKPFETADVVRAVTRLARSTA
jgi:CheY-like chemotaxis protein